MMSVVRNASGMVIRRFALLEGHTVSTYIEIGIEEKGYLRVIESSLEPLNTRGHQSVLLDRHQMSRQ